MKVNQNNMNFTDAVEVNRIEQYETLSETKLVYLFTNVEARPAKKCDWFYRVLVEDEFFYKYPIDEGSGFLGRCACSECTNLGDDLCEYFSVLQALRWASVHSSYSLIRLWISSNKILSQATNQEFWALGTSNCPFLKSLGNELHILTSELNVDIVQYGYSNKEIIPYFFEADSTSKEVV